MLEIVQWTFIGVAIGSIANLLTFIDGRTTPMRWKEPLISAIGAVLGGVAISLNSEFQAYSDVAVSGLILSLVGAVLTLSAYKAIRFIRERDVLWRYNYKKR